MNIKIQKVGKDGTSDNKGSSSKLVNYLCHEDEEREAKGLGVVPFTTPDGEVASKEDVIRRIDENGKGLGRDEGRFYHIVVSPDPKEIQAMGKDDKEVYTNALYYLKLLSDYYAQAFHREGINDSSDLVMFWKVHFTRGENDDLQFHVHGIVSRNSSGAHGKKMKISPMTNHRDTQDGPVVGGFDRTAFYREGEKLFDDLFEYERLVCDTFNYRNAMAHGTAEEKAEQIAREINESSEDMKKAVSEGVARRFKTIQAKKEVEDIAAVIEKEGLTSALPPHRDDGISVALELADRKNEILRIFATEKTPKGLYLALATIGVTCTFKFSSDGVEDVSIEHGGETVLAHEIMTTEELHSLFSDITRITGHEAGYKVREKREAQKAKREKERELDKGPSIGR